MAYLSHLSRPKVESSGIESTLTTVYSINYI